MPTYVRMMWWQIEKDLLRELRMPRTWPAMILLGCVLAWLSTMQFALPTEYQLHVNSGLFWLTTFFAGSMVIERSFASERENGCWESLVLYPLTPANLFLAKMISNFLALNCLASVLVTIFTMFADTRFLARPMPFVALVLLGNLGFAAAGTLISAITSGIANRNHLLVLLILPLLTPVLIGASEATRLLHSGVLDGHWWRWVHLLIAFDVAFVTVGMLLFEFVVEE